MKSNIQVEAVKSKVLRGEILEYLYFICPKAVNENIIIKLFIEYYKQEEIIKALFYLADKGYIKAIHDKPKKYQITAKGMDLLHGDIEDKGVFTKGL
jgi:predicted transcriptional regulator